jgi:hypothetical protein
LSCTETAAPTTAASAPAKIAIINIRWFFIGLVSS